MLDILIVLSLVAFFSFGIIGFIGIIKKNRKAARWFLFSAASFVLMIICALNSPDTEKVDNGENITASAIAKVDEAKPEPATTEAPKTDDSKKVIAQVEKVAKKKFRSIESITYTQGYMLITAAGNDTFSGDMAKKNILKDMAGVLEEISKTDVQTVRFGITLPFKDINGNVAEKMVLVAEYDREAIDKIDWDGFDYNNLSELAKTYSEDNALK